MSNGELNNSLDGLHSPTDELKLTEHTLKRAEKTTFSDIGQVFDLGVLNSPIRFQIYWRPEDQKWLVWSNDPKIPRTGISGDYFDREFTFGRHDSCHFTTTDRHCSQSDPNHWVQFSVFFNEKRFSIKHTGKHDTTVKTLLPKDDNISKPSHHGTVKELDKNEILKAKIEYLKSKSTAEVQVALGFSSSEWEENKSQQVKRELQDFFAQGKSIQATADWTKASIRVKWAFSDLENSSIPELDVYNAYQIGDYHDDIQALQILTIDKYLVIVERLQDGSLRYFVSNELVKKKIQNFLKAAQEENNNYARKVIVPIGLSLKHLVKAGARELTIIDDPEIERSTRDWYKIQTTEIKHLKINIIHEQIFYVIIR